MEEFEDGLVSNVDGKTGGLFSHKLTVLIVYTVLSQRIAAKPPAQITGTI